MAPLALSSTATPSRPPLAASIAAKAAGSPAKGSAAARAPRAAAMSPSPATIPPAAIPRLPIMSRTPLLHGPDALPAGGSTNDHPSRQA